MTTALMPRRNTAAARAAASALLIAGFRPSGHWCTAVPGVSGASVGISARHSCVLATPQVFSGQCRAFTQSCCGQQLPSCAACATPPTSIQLRPSGTPRLSSIRRARGGHSKLRQAPRRGQQTRRMLSSRGLRAEIQNRELLVGDVLALVCFCMYKQITAIMLLPHFPGLLAPLSFSPLRFAEFASFSATVVGTWVGVSLLVGGYKTDSTAGLATAASRTCLTWLLSMPVAAAQARPLSWGWDDATPLYPEP